MDAMGPLMLLLFHALLVQALLRSPALAGDYSNVIEDVLSQEETSGCDIVVFYDETSLNMVSNVLRNMADMEHPKVVTISAGTRESVVKMARKKVRTVDIIWGTDSLIAEHMSLAKSIRGTTAKTDFYLAVPTATSAHDPEEYAANEFRNFATILREEESKFVVQTFCAYCLTSTGTI